MGASSAVGKHPTNRAVEHYLTSILSAVTLLVAVGQSLFLQSVPWPLVLGIGPVGVWTPLVFAALLSIAVLFGAVRGFRADSASRTTISFAVLAGVTLLATVLGVVVPYVRLQGVLIAVYPGMLLSVLLASLCLGTNLYTVVANHI